ncbi:MAG: glycosyltransferase [Actinomycetota bacterium]
MSERVYFFHAPTLQNAIRRMTEELAEAVACRGYETRLFSPADDTAEFDQDVAAGRVAAVVSLNLYGFPAPFVETMRAARVPLFFYSTDHPYLGYEDHRFLLQSFPVLRISLTGEDEVAAARHLHGRGDFQVLRQATTPHDEAPWAARDIPHVVVGNNPVARNNDRTQHPEIFRQLWPGAIGPEGAARANRMVEIHDAAPLKPLAEVLEEAISVEAAPVDMGQRMRTVFLFDLYLRTRVRLRALEKLAELPAVICGDGWDFLRQRPCRAHFLGSVDTARVLALIRRARFVYNLVPPYYSCSERVLEAAVVGTPVATTPSRFFEREFGDALWTIGLDGDPSALLDAPPAEDDLRARAARARAAVLERHTWAERAGHIVDFIRTQDRTAA